MDGALAGKVNDVPGKITSFEVAVLPANDTLNVKDVVLVVLAFTTNVAGDGLFTTLDVETIVSVGTGAADDLGEHAAGTRAATALVIVGGPIVSPADVSAPSSYPAPCCSATFTVCVGLRRRAGVQVRGLPLREREAGLHGVELVNGARRIPGGLQDLFELPDVGSLRPDVELPEERERAVRGDRVAAVEREDRLGPSVSVAPSSR